MLKKFKRDENATPETETLAQKITNELDAKAAMRKYIKEVAIVTAVLVPVAFAAGILSAKIPSAEEKTNEN